MNTNLLWNFTLLFVLLCTLYFGFIFFFRRKLSLESKAIEERKKELTPMIVEFLFYDEDSNKQEESDYVNLKVEIRELINNSFNRKILIDILMYLRNDLSGTTLNKLFKLYQSLGLHQDSYNKLKSWKWQYISKGILELTQMNVEDSYVFITKFINDKRGTIRKQAEVAIITLKPEGLSYFLDTTTYRISEWQQLKILEVLINKKNYLPPSFSHWLISKNNDVVLFALRLMKNYNQSDGNEALIELLKHKNANIKLAAISCIKEFHVIEAFKTLKLVFWNSSIDIKISILDVISSLGDKNAIKFLKTVGNKESNFNVKSKSLACINAIEPMSVLPTIDIQSVDTFTIPKDIVLSATDNLNPKNDTLDDNSIELVTALDSKIEKAIVDAHVANEHIVSQTNIDELDKSKFSTNIEAVVIAENTNINSETQEALELNLGTDTHEKQTLDGFSIEFLPFVLKEVNTTGVKYNPNNRKKLSTTSILEIEVINEEALSKSTDKDLKVKIPNLDHFENEINEIEVDFIPIIIPNKEKTNCDSQVISETINPTELTVEYTEIVSRPYEEHKIPHKTEESEALTKPNILKSSSKNNHSKTPSSINNIDMKNIKNIECDVKEVKIENQQAPECTSVLDSSEVYQHIATENKIEKTALEWVLAENEAQLEMKQKIKSILNNQDGVSFNIPKPIFYNEREANTMLLLDDIESLGDSREIPLLKEQLSGETEISIRERLEYLIIKLTNTEVLKKQPIKQDNIVFSVFEVYFTRLDVQSKLILLDEIVGVGDEKEVPFLKRLIASSSEKISKKAEICLARLTEKLINEKVKVQTESEDTKNESESESEKIIKATADQSLNKIIEKPFNVFEIDFDLALEGLKDAI